VKQLKHPATIIASVALFVALGGGAVAYAAGVINGSQIKNHTIASKKLTKKAIKQLKGNRGPAGAPGAAGAAGATGATGPQGPGGTIATWDATAQATATPTYKTIPTLSGDTFQAACVTSAGDAELLIKFFTSDGSWDTDLQISDSVGDILAASIVAPAGTFTSSAPLAGSLETAASGGDVESIRWANLQLGPAPAGEEIWFATASTANSASTCHLSIETIPEAHTTVTARHAAPRAGMHLPLHFGNTRLHLTHK
jgi:hypothetical protein